MVHDPKMYMIVSGAVQNAGIMGRFGTGGTVELVDSLSSALSKASSIF